MSLSILLIFMKEYILVDWELFRLNGSTFVYRVLIDWIRSLFLRIVFLISRCVMFYSHEYISYEKIKNSFCVIVFLFVISILFLIISPNLVRVILGWDGLGLVSYLLVVYYQNYKSYGAGMITCLTNRVGDRALLIAIAWLLRRGSLDFIYYYSLRSVELTICGSFIVLAAITKRAQVPFSAWLPAAIAAPTPVSALVHSSTLVTAGVYLLIRFFPIFSRAFANEILLSLGLITLIISSLRAFYEIDLKKVIALSTLRQLGVIIVSLGLKLHLLTFFHLLSHALFKASLFLRAGRIIHLYSGRQDIRHLGKVSQNMPYTRSCLVVCSLALGGAPFLSGFYSKDKIIEESLIREGVFVWLILILSVVSTIIYSFRLIYYLSSSFYSLSSFNVEDSRLITKRIRVLTLGGILGGRFLIWSYFSFSYDNLTIFLKFFLLFIFIAGGLVGYFVNFFSPRRFAKLLGMIWVTPRVTAQVSSKVPLMIGDYLYKYWDRGWAELLGPRGAVEELKSLGLDSRGWSRRGFKSMICLIFIITILFYFIFY